MPELAPFEWILLGWGAVATLLCFGLYGVAALVVHLRRPARVEADAADGLPGLTLIRPLKGLDPGAEACHRSLLEGRYRPDRVLFVVESEQDPAVGPVRRICAEDERCQLVIADPRPEILSGKIRNLLAGWARADTPLVGFCDSDIVLGPEHLARCMEELAADPQLAAVSLPTLYDAESGVGRFTMLVMTIDCATLGRAMARTRTSGAAVGGLLLARRAAIEEIGGLERLGDALADDLRLARLLDQAGHQVRFADTVLVHRSGPEPARSHLLRHHRWLTSLRTETPGFFWAQLLALNPVLIWLFAAALLAVLGSGWASAALALAGLAAAARVLQAAFVDVALLRPHGVRLGAWVLALPLADLVYGAVLLISFLVPFVHWRGRWLRVSRWSGRPLAEVAASTTA